MLTQGLTSIHRIGCAFTRAARRAEGQTTVFLLLFVFLFGALGAAVVDVGFLLNARREAQSDADRAALAGALELSLSADPSVQATDEANAVSKAVTWAQKNGVTDGLIVNTVSSCFSGDDGLPTGVQVTVEKDPPTLFLGMLGIADWTASATAVSCSSGRDVAVVLDRSGSMCHDTYPWAGGSCPHQSGLEPFTSVQEAAISFASNFSTVYDQMALISYSSSATTDLTLGNDFGPGGDFEEAVEDMHPSGNTNIGAAIRLGRLQLVGPNAQPDAAKVMVLLTDGIANEPYNTSYARDYAEDQAELTADEGILIYVIGLGDSLDEDLLEEIASIGGGAYLNAPEASDLQDAFQTIADLAQPRLTQ